MAPQSSSITLKNGRIYPADLKQIELAKASREIKFYLVVQANLGQHSTTYHRVNDERSPRWENWYEVQLWGKKLDTFPVCNTTVGEIPV